MLSQMAAASGQCPKKINIYNWPNDFNTTWIFLSLDTETTPVSFFYNIESYFCVNSLNK